MNTFELHILAAERSFYEGPCESLILPLTEGMYGIQANHVNMIAGVVPGELTYRVPGGVDEHAACSRGMVKVENNEVTVLVDTVERPEEIDVNRAQRAADEAKEELLKKRNRQEYMKAQMELARAMTRLRVSKLKKPR
ncbi:MAG: ATP synthase F1 subunit epsilon [Firmicutes bacterium]|nr:ATP synthase F1 subunit epsilon [Bacillota bacterium]